MTESSHAVFLSYASQDADAAQRICEALRAAGIEVWFDQSELRGGDAWDQSIRRQIKHCGLFIPIISQHTHERTEGYFRLEWKLAVDRSHLITANKPFIVPLVIDDTRDDEENVPEKFREVQWTRLSGGKTPSAFVERVQRLLSGATSTTDRARVALEVAAPIPDQSPLSRWSKRAGVAAAALVILGAVAYFAIDRVWLLYRAFNAPHNSIAVLPFADMSEAHDQEYFSDGLAEELLDLLSRTPGLKVIARTSSFSFKGKADDVPTIARKLGVAHILEGSVRKVGNRLRVTTQLVRADTGEHLWSETYDRELRDVFQVQDEIASAVVLALKTHLEIAPAADRQTRTASTDAHDAYLQARQTLRRASRDGYGLAESAFQRAIALDPNFAPAYAGLAEAEALFADTVTGDITQYQRAAEAADTAVTLAPDLASARALRGWIRFKFFWEWAGSQEDIRAALRMTPGDSEVLLRSAELADALGRSPEAAASARRALDSDPLSGSAWADLGKYLTHARDLAGARGALKRALELSPESIWAWAYTGYVSLLEGDARAAMEIADNPRVDRDVRLHLEALAAYSLGDRDRSDRALATLIATRSKVFAYEIAQNYAWRRDPEHAFAWLARARVQHDGGLIRVGSDPLFAAVRADARYRALLREIWRTE